MTCSCTTPPSRLMVTAVFRRTSGSSTRPDGAPRARRPSRSSRSSPSGYAGRAQGGASALPAHSSRTSELDQLGAGRSQALLVRPEVNKHAHPLLDTDDCAEAIFVVGHLVIDRVSLHL